MGNSKHWMALTGAVLMGAGVANAESSSTPLESEVAALKARIAQLEGRQSENWLNERRAEEVKALVREVLADADTRASLLEGGMSAGHNGSNFFLASEDGNFLMNVGGQVQVRYIWNSRDDATADGSDDNETGFQIRRAKVQFDGHVISPDWLYLVRLSADQDSTEVNAEEVTIGYRLGDGLTLRAGRSKAPFMREELIQSQHQLAVERSLVNEILTSGYVEGIFVDWDATDMIKVSGSLDDGDFSGEVNGANDFDNDDADIAVGGRVDVLLAGTWDQVRDFSAWSGQDTSIVVGAAGRWIKNETGDTSDNDATFKWTVDASAEMAGFNVFASFGGHHFDAEDDLATEDNTDLYGLVVQGGYMFIPDKLEAFARYEWTEFDDPTDAVNDQVNIVTFGVNYYFAKHASKLTVDLVYVLDPLDASNVSLSGAGDREGLGLLHDDTEDNQFALRAQWQLLF